MKPEVLERRAKTNAFRAGLLVALVTPWIALIYAIRLVCGKSPLSQPSG